MDADRIRDHYTFQFSLFAFTTDSLNFFYRDNFNKKFILENVILRINSLNRERERHEVIIFGSEWEIQYEYRF